MIPKKVYANENMYGSKEDKERYSRSGEFIENMVTDNEIEFCKRWFHLAGFNELLEDANEYFASKMFCNRTYIEAINSYNDRIEIPLIPPSNNGVINPLSFGYDHHISALHFKMPDNMKQLIDNIK